MEYDIYHCVVCQYTWWDIIVSWAQACVHPTGWPSLSVGPTQTCVHPTGEPSLSIGPRYVSTQLGGHLCQLGLGMCPPNWVAIFVSWAHPSICPPNWWAIFVSWAHAFLHPTGRPSLSDGPIMFVCLIAPPNYINTLFHLSMRVPPPHPQL